MLKIKLAFGTSKFSIETQHRGWSTGQAEDRLVKIIRHLSCTPELYHTQWCHSGWSAMGTENRSSQPQKSVTTEGGWSMPRPTDMKGLFQPLGGFLSSLHLPHSQWKPSFLMYNSGVSWNVELQVLKPQEGSPCENSTFSYFWSEVYIGALFLER